MTVTLSDAARECREMLKRGWTRVEPAVDAAGERCPSWDRSRAVAWSVLGSVSGCSAPNHVKLMLLGRLRAFSRVTLSEWNAHPDANQSAAVALMTSAIQDGRD